MRTLPERDLICAAMARDDAAYRELVSRYIRPALAVAWEFTDTLEDAEDLVQEAFRRVVEALPRFDAGRPFAPWFFTILRNVARNTVSARGRRLHAALDDSVPDEAVRPDEAVDYLELEARVGLELDSLPDMQRACFRLCVLEGFSSQEVAEALGVNDRTVRTHVHRARRSMQKALRPFVEEEQER
jgi:RNA polymerase sigma-70 factor (ECF subfamily)